MRSLWRRFVAFLFSIGEYPQESSEQGARRRIFVGVNTAASVITVPFVFDLMSRGYTNAAIATGLSAAMGLPVLILLYLKPRWFFWIVNGTFALVTLGQLYDAWLFGGLLESGVEVVFGLVVALAALLVLGRRAGLFWFGMYVFSVIFAMTIAGSVEPTYVADNATTDGGSNLIALGVLVMAVTLYFVRQRDRFQKQSDDLLHNILPDEIATRLKKERTMIADHYESTSVLFADVVNFTPMSTTLTPPELVGLLNTVFTTFDGFVAELGLEKIKTVGDEYMVASGVPRTRSDHAHAMAELALRIRDHAENNKFDGHQLSLRIGVNSGPVVAGIVGTHKFAYDLWGDAVNTASRMESEGVAGLIQVTQATYELIRDKFNCEPRGTINVKGKGEMETYILRSKRADAPAR